MYVQGRGTVVTGRVEQGIVKTGDNVEVVGIRPNIQTTVTGGVTGAPFPTTRLVAHSYPSPAMPPVLALHATPPPPRHLSSYWFLAPAPYLPMQA